MNLEIRKHLIDIMNAGLEIQSFTRNMKFGVYKESLVTQRAVERDFEIIGEALTRIRKLDESCLGTISEHRRIIGFRNILIHGYDTIDDAIVWNAVEKHLPVLLKEVNHLLAES